MKPLTCEEVDELLPWCAAGECEPDQRGLVEQHLAHCPRCRQGYGETERLLTLLDWHERADKGLQSLQERLLQEPRRISARQAVRPFVRRLAAVAALLLVAVGLTGWISPPGEEFPDIAVAHGGGENVDIEHGVVRAPGPEHSKTAARLTRDGGTAIASLELGGRSPEEYRRHLLDAAKKDHLPNPPRVDRTLELCNRSKRVLYLDVGGEGTELHLDLSGPGVLVLSGDQVPEREIPFLSRSLVRLAPGESYLLPIPRLIDGTRGHLRSLFWTEPGSYVLGIRYRVRVFDHPPSPEEKHQGRSFRTYTSPFVTIQVRQR